MTSKLHLIVSLLATVILFSQANPISNETASTCSGYLDSCDEEAPCCQGFQCINTTDIRSNISRGKVALNGGVLESDDLEYEVFTEAYPEDDEAIENNTPLEEDTLDYGDEADGCTSDDCFANEDAPEDPEFSPMVPLCMPVKGSA